MSKLVVSWIPLLTLIECEWHLLYPITRDLPDGHKLPKMTESHSVTMATAPSAPCMCPTSLSDLCSVSWLKWSTTQVLFSVGTLLQTGRSKKKSWQWILRHRRCWAVQVFCILCHCTLVSLSLPPAPIILHESSLLPTFPTSADPSGYLPCLVLALHTQDMFLCFFWWPVPCLLPIQELLIPLSRNPWLPACQETLFCSGGCP